MQSELQQYHDMDTYFPINPKELTRQQKREALESLMNLVKNVTEESRRDAQLMEANKDKWRDM